MPRRAVHQQEVPGFSPYAYAPRSYSSTPTCGGCHHCAFDHEAKGHGCQLAMQINGRWSGVIETGSPACQGWQPRTRA